MMEDDRQLLGRYIDDHSESAFSELVRRHVSLVYYAALRRVGGDAHLADDVAQAVFVDLARKASRLRDREILAGWLYTSTRFAAAQAVRGERRRRTHEEEAQTMNELHSTLEPDWNQLRPFIDEAMDELNERDREAVLLRFFENRPLAEVGAKFSLSPDAARMRIERALEKLRVLLAKRGIGSTSAALAAAFAGQSGLAAPAGLVARIVGVSLDASRAGASATLAIAKILTVGAMAVLGVGLTLHFSSKRDPVENVAAEGPAGFESTARAIEPILESAAVTKAPEPVVVPPRPGSLPTVIRADLKLEALSEMQKTILKTLWDHQAVAPDHPPVRWGFRMAPNAPQAADFQASAALLQAQGFVGLNSQTGIVSFTRKGQSFCAAHAAELAALPTKLQRFRPLMAKEN